uniref:Phosphomevalonate kinase n=1 Tax=Timema genevievae TaxID=629358 RepID=A0A7R9PND5_TIMGE|nr:unnamed protein product [Timema genevievae]
MQTNTTHILLISGKRKSGKDFTADKIIHSIEPEKSVLMRISAPIKSHWSKKHNLDFEALQGTSEYKEKYRKAMIEWGENIRREDYGYFCRAAVDMFHANEKPVWIVSDIRRKSDLQWFRENFSNVVKCMRMTASDDIRTQRGWVFTPGVDDVESECGLDDVTDWDWLIYNNGDQEEYEAALKPVLDWLK